MAYSKCPNCDNRSFEVTENSPSKSQFKLMFVQCSKCGCVVGTMDYFNIGARISELEKKINDISLTDNTSTIKNNLNILNENITRLFNYVKIGFEKIEKTKKTE